MRKRYSNQKLWGKDLMSVQLDMRGGKNEQPPSQDKLKTAFREIVSKGLFEQAKNQLRGTEAQLAGGAVEVEVALQPKDCTELCHNHGPIDVPRDSS